MWYIVQPGDSLSLISLKFGVPVQTLMWANSIANGVIYIGQKLFVPSSSRVNVTYYVKVGDTLDSIAQQYNTTKQAIMQQNNLDTDLVVPGQKLQIEARYGITRPVLTYAVYTGDTLDSIAQKFNTTKQSIMQLNKLTSETVFPGQELQIDTPVRPTGTYTVEIGDTLDSIANKFKTTKQAIMLINNLASEDIKAGQTLTLNIETRRMQHPTDLRHQSPPDIAPYKIEYMTFYDSGLQTNIKIWKAAGKKGTTFFFVSKLSVTAAGADKAFHQNNELAFDFLSRAGTEGYWWGLVTDPSGNPIVQGDKDPAHGYYISKTVLSDCTKPVTDPTRYLDATVVPYIALPARHMMGAKIGDLCVLINTMNNKIGYAIVGDVGPDDYLGIGSMALAEKLGIPSSPKTGGVEDGILYIIFAQSGENICSPQTPQRITERAQHLFEQWGGMKQVDTLFGKFPLSHKINQ